MNFHDTVNNSPIPVHPHECGLPTFEDMLVYTFVNSLQSRHMWTEAARPSHMVATYPVALQQANLTLRAAPNYTQWWNTAYETTPMEDLYKQELHASVDIACSQQGWSEKDKAALHNYVDEFMHELHEPKHHIGAGMCRDMLMSFAKMSGEYMQDMFDISKTRSYSTRTFLIFAADYVAQQIPQSVNFESTFSICSMMESDFIAEQLENEPDMIREQYPAESAFVRILLDARYNGLPCTNIQTQPAHDARKFAEALPECVRTIIDNSHIRFTGLTAFHEDDIAWDDFVGEFHAEYMERCVPELLERYAKERACITGEGMSADGTYFDSDEIARGFVKTSPCVDEVFDYLDPLTEQMSLLERQHFVVAFQMVFNERPWDLAGTLQSTLEYCSDTYVLSEEIEDILPDLLEDAKARDEEFFSQWSDTIPAAKIAEETLSFMRRCGNPAQACEVSEQQYAAFETFVRAQVEANLITSYAELGTLAAGYLPSDAQKQWKAVVCETIGNHTCSGGYEFANRLAASIARHSDTLMSLSMEQRADFAKALDEAANHCTSLTRTFREACSILDEDTAAYISDTIKKETLSLECEDMDRDDY